MPSNDNYPPISPKPGKVVESVTHQEKRLNNPSAEHESVIPAEIKEELKVAFERRDADLDPQLIWRGKTPLDWSDLVVSAPPIYIQERVHPKYLVKDLIAASGREPDPEQPDLFADFNGFEEGVDRTDFYNHPHNWSNRLILGDSLSVMASLAEREELRGKVQCIYIDPPYGIKFNSNFQWSTTSRDVKDGKAEHITREPEMVKAFRDTWRDGIHSYLSYLRDRLVVAKDLLTESGSIFVQIGDENVHRIRTLLDEVFGSNNCISQISFVTTSPFTTDRLSGSSDYILWYAKNIDHSKFRRLWKVREERSGEGTYNWIETPDLTERRLTAKEQRGDIAMPEGTRFRAAAIVSSGVTASGCDLIQYEGKDYAPSPRNHWKTTTRGMYTLAKAGRVLPVGKVLSYKRRESDFPVMPFDNVWTDTIIGSYSNKVYVVQTAERVIERCLLMATDPGDLVLDPTCGSGTTAYVAEQWGRRWITIDTSRVALALARGRLMGARYPYYLLADSPEGQAKTAEITGKPVSDRPTGHNIGLGFVYERVPHITLRDIANNAEIDEIHEKWQPLVERKLAHVNKLLTLFTKDPRSVTKDNSELKILENFPDKFEEWEVPRTSPFKFDDQDLYVKHFEEGKSNFQKRKEPALFNPPKNQTPEEDMDKGDAEIPSSVAFALAIEDYYDIRIRRQREIDDSIQRNANYEYLYDKPYEDKKRVRVAGPFTVESLSPVRSLVVDQDDRVLEHGQPVDGPSESDSFLDMVFKNIKFAGIQQAHKADKIEFDFLNFWPGRYLCMEGRFQEGDTERRAGLLVGPEFGSLRREDLVMAAREAGDAGFDLVIAVAFHFDANCGDFQNLGAIKVLQARMNADLHMAGELKEDKRANLFVIFGEPDIDVLPTDDGQVQVKINGVDVFDPQTGKIRSDNADGIACWMVDTDYNGEAFFVRHAYFLGANDPYKSLKVSLKAEIDKEAWDTLNSDTSRPFPKPKSGRIAVKVINHLGDEVMKVYEVKD